jgi:hypothetical protein
MNQVVREDRVLTLKTAQISADGMSLRIDCAILNLSAHGACLLVSDESEIPDRFHLATDFGGPRYECKVAWRNDSRIGVSFESVDAAAPGPLEP